MSINIMFCFDKKKFPETYFSMNILSTHFDILTPIERDVIFLLVCGFGVTDIAKKKSRSIKTISTHKINAYKKLGVKGDIFLIVNLILNNCITRVCEEENLVSVNGDGNA